MQGSEGRRKREGSRIEVDLVVDFLQNDCSQFGILARARDASAVGRFEDRAVGGANQVAVLVGQESIRGPVERATLVGTGIEPGARDA